MFQKFISVRIVLLYRNLTTNTTNKCIKLEDKNGLNKKYLNTLKIYCDGSCLNNGKSDNSKQALGIGIHFPSHSEFDLSEGFPKKPGVYLTNNQAEILAALFSLKQAGKIIIKYPNRYEKVIVHTDSRYVVEGMNVWSIKWIKNNWKNSNKNQVVNKDGFIKIIKEREKLKDIEVVWKHIKGHDGNSFNEMAHQLAFDASSKAIMPTQIVEDHSNIFNQNEIEIVKGTENDLKKENLKTLEIYNGSILSDNGESDDTNQAIGIGVHLPSHNDFDISVAESVSKLTISEAELIAALFSLKQATKVIKKYPNAYEKVIVNTDSRYVVKGMNVWSIKWIKNNWKNSKEKPIVNKDGFIEILKEREKLKEIEVVWQHAENNKKKFFNQEAQNLAKNAMKKKLKDSA